MPIQQPLYPSRFDAAVTHVGNYTDAQLAEALRVIANLQTANYTLMLTDAGKVVEMLVGTTNTVTVPPNATVAFPIGTVIEIYQAGLGSTTILADSGVIVRERENKRRLAGQYATAALRKRGVDEWVLAGDVAAPLVETTPMMTESDPILTEGGV